MIKHIKGWRMGWELMPILKILKSKIK